MEDLRVGNICVVTMVNDEALYQKSKRSLERQGRPGFFKFIPVYADKRGWNASTALNYGIGLATSRWVVCVHQDVIFPDKWLDRFLGCLAGVPKDTAIVGLVGQSSNGRFVGHVKDPHGHSRFRSPPSKVVSVDELLIALRNSDGPLFDPANPGFHCYGTDICLSVRAKGQKACVVDAPVIHLSGGKSDAAFDVSSSWLLAKWGKYYNYVIPTCSGVIELKRKSNYLKRMMVRIQRRMSMMGSVCDCDAVGCSEYE